MTSILPKRQELSNAETVFVVSSAVWNSPPNYSLVTGVWSTIITYKTNLAASPSLTTSQSTTTSGGQTNPTTPNPTSTLSPTSSTTTASHNGKLGGGPIAGIAIACFVAGVAIGCLLIFLIISWRKWRYGGGHVSDGNMDGRSGSGRAPEKSLAYSTISIPQDSSAAIVQNNLPQPVEDNAIKTELSKLKDRVSDHIQSYYNLAKTGGPVASQDIQQVLSNNSPVSPEKFSHLLADPKTRSAILRYALAWVILSRVGLECDPSISFLPWHVASCLHDMAESKLNDRGEFDIRSFCYREG